MNEIVFDNKNKVIPILCLFIFISVVFIVLSDLKNESTFVPSVIETKSNETNQVDEIKEVSEVNEEFVLNKDNLIGIWQDIPNMASGWSDHYNFYPSGKYTLYFSEMNCTKRILTESGFWQFDNSTSNLTLIVKQRTKIEGGILDQTSVCEWQGGEKIIETVTNSETREYKLSVPTDSIKYGQEIINPNDTPWYKMVVFNDRPFWRFNDEVTGSEGDNFPEPTGF